MSWRKTHLSQTKASKNPITERSHVFSLRVKLLAHAFSNSGPTHGLAMAIKAGRGGTQEREGRMNFGNCKTQRPREELGRAGLLGVTYKRSLTPIAQGIGFSRSMHCITTNTCVISNPYY